MMRVIPDTFGEWIDIILGRNLLFESNSKSARVDFVCNTYPDVSIKNMEIEILKKNCEVFDRKY